MTWKPGPARTRSDEYEAEVFKDDGRYIYGLYRKKCHVDWSMATWFTTGRQHARDESSIDLLPPLMTSEEAVDECCDVMDREWEVNNTQRDAMRAALDHYDQLIRDGRVACPCGGE